MAHIIERGNPAYPWNNKSANPCTSCGACCAAFRVSFYGGEADDSPWGTVPVELTESLTHSRLAMRGTNQRSPRCIALSGELGKCVSCTIHPVRPSVCRGFPPSWENGIHNPDCDRARARQGLPPLENPEILPLAPDDTPTTPRTPKRAA